MPTIEIDVVELVLRVEAAKQGAGEIPAGSNAGPYPERVLGVTGNHKGDPWCASDVSDTGHIALQERWPMPLTASCQALADFARKKKILYPEPKRGDLWLRWSPSLKRFAHVGFVLSVSPDRMHIEVQAGNTIRPGQAGDVREGWLNWVRVEPIGPNDRFARWAELFKPFKEA